MRALTCVMLFCFSSFSIQAQCPNNIDYEQGNFSNWECWIGSVTQVGGINTIVLGATPVAPDPLRHVMYSTIPGDGVDPYGFFPKNCPNGSGHSIRLGNDGVGAQAEGVSYTFTIPAGQNTFNLTYYYAIVLHEGTHTPEQQARMIIEVQNVTDGTPLPCPLQPFVVGGGLPGFDVSPTPPPPGASPGPIRFKPWAAASIKLDNLAGKTIRVFFKTADCTAQGHFGYAYIDIAGQCSNAFVGATFCPDDAFINVTAPYGYAGYKWWNASDPTTIIGITQTLNFTPPPPPGTILQVEVTPFAGYGCIDTFTAILQDTLTIQSVAGPDQLSCNLTPVQLGTNPKPGYVYSWSPATGLSNPAIANPIATPTTTTTYVVTTTHEGGGCLTTDTVVVKAAVLDSSLQVTGLDTYCMGDPQAAVLKVHAADSIQWYRNGVAIPGATQTEYHVTQSGTYHATVFSFVGCSSNTVTKDITVHDVPVAGFNINSPINQCFNNHQFIFNNTSTIASGTMTYNWDFGDGNTSAASNATHSYTQTGTYIVKLTVTSDNGCIDSAKQTVSVYPNSTVDFTVDKNEQCFAGNKFSFTNNSTIEAGASMNYYWTFGDGGSSLVKDVVHSYSAPGTYTVKLLITTDKGCADSLSLDVTVHPDPVAGFTINNAQQCFGGNDFVFTNTTNILSGTLQYIWYFGDGTTAGTLHANHSYAESGDYRIKMVATSDKGCADSIYKDVNIIPYPKADFLVKDPACINQEVMMVNKTFNNTTSTLIYRWDFDNGQSSSLQSPHYSYPGAGNFNLKLSVSTVQCPTTINTKIIPIVIEAPVPGIVYPDKEVIYNFPEKLQARNIGNNVIWTPALNLDNRYSYTPTYRGTTTQLYSIQLKTPNGCVTVDSLLVRAKKKIEIYVPTVFTPDKNGTNDYLRPLLFGFDHVNYFRIYNRWGKLLFQMNSDRPGWDGTVNGQLTTETQTVVWMIEAVDVDGVVHRKQGTTVLLK